MNMYLPIAIVPLEICEAVHRDTNKGNVRVHVRVSECLVCVQKEQPSWWL